MYPNLTVDENFMITHWRRWGSDSGIVTKTSGRKWTIGCRNISHPMLFATKREALAALDTWVSAMAKRGR